MFLVPFPCNPMVLFHPTPNLWPCSRSVCREEGGKRQNGMVSGADRVQGAMPAWTGGCRIRDGLLAVAVQLQTHPAGDKGIFPPFFAMRLGEMQLLIARRLKWRTRLPAEVTNSDRSDAVAMVTMVSWETPKGCHGIPSPIPLGPRSSHKNLSRWFQPCHPTGHRGSAPQCDPILAAPSWATSWLQLPLCRIKHP